MHILQQLEVKKGMINMLEERTWKEFRDIKLLWFVNTILHLFGWAIVYEENDNGEVKHHVFKWYTLDEMKDKDIRTKELLNILENNLERQHIIKYQESLI